MPLRLFLLSLKWHFVLAPRALMTAWGNILWFYLHYFSVGYLLRTLFSPWRKYQWGYGKGFNIQRYAEAFFSNLLSRIIGAVIRLVMVLGGVGTDVVLLAGATASIVFWIALPFLIITALIYGAAILF